jgi:hypothetical protein
LAGESACPTQTVHVNVGQTLPSANAAIHFFTDSEAEAELRAEFQHDRKDIAAGAEGSPTKSVSDVSPVWCLYHLTA